MVLERVLTMRCVIVIASGGLEEIYRFLCKTCGALYSGCLLMMCEVFL